jgi:Glyoxalase/Bleomycin resistance protein/Dioxygenase superfamily
MAQFSFDLPVGAVCQFAFYVTDIPAAMREYAQQLNVGPWFYMERVAIKNTYRGKPTVFNGSIAVGYAGPMQIELIHQSDAQPSVFMEIDAGRRNGLHHQAVAVRDFDGRIKAYTESGFETAMYVENEFRNRIAYIDTKGKLPFFIEVVEVNEIVERVYTALYRTSMAWDGTDPIRRFSSIGELVATANKSSG